jgi:hypothetical protein
MNIHKNHVIFGSLTNLCVITKPCNYDVIMRFRNYMTTLKIMLQIMLKIMLYLLKFIKSDLVCSNKGFLIKYVMWLAKINCKSVDSLLLRFFACRTYGAMNSQVPVGLSFTLLKYYFQAYKLFSTEYLPGS